MQHNTCHSGDGAYTLPLAYTCNIKSIYSEWLTRMNATCPYYIVHVKFVACKGSQIFLILFISPSPQNLDLQ